jgi:hypothetical protein
MILLIMTSEEGRKEGRKEGALAFSTDFNSTGSFLKSQANFNGGQ